MIRLDTPYVDPDRTLTQAGYEVLKGQERVSAALDARIAAVEAGKAPLPQAAAGVGQFVQIFNGAGVAGVLPAGGTWAYDCLAFTAPGGTLTAGGSGGILAGGSTYLAANAGRQGVAMAWRIA